MPAIMKDLAAADPAVPAEFAVYVAPGAGPLSPHELDVVRLQTADLLGCDAAELRPVAVELQGVDGLQAEFAHLPAGEQSRDPYLALLALLRNGAHAVGRLCCVLLYDLHAPFPALDYLKGLSEITHLPVLLAVCRQPPTGSAHRQILLRHLR
jgi:hypothetical protein